MTIPTITLEIDGKTVTRTPPRATLCASCLHFGDFVTGAEWCDLHEQQTMLRRDGRLIVVECTGHEPGEDGAE